MVAGAARDKHDAAAAADDVARLHKATQPDAVAVTLQHEHSTVEAELQNVSLGAWQAGRTASPKVNNPGPGQGMTQQGGGLCSGR